MKKVYKREDFPTEAKYKRDKNRIYSVWDFKDGDDLTFYCFPDKPSSLAEGYAYYRRVYDIQLIHIEELERKES